MSTDVITKCDYCGEELKQNGAYPHNYGLRLSSVDYGPVTSGMVHAVHMPPVIDSAKDFCGMFCLKSWLNEEA